MYEKVDHIIHLIGKHFRNELTLQENEVLQQWLSENEEHRNLLTLLSDDNAMEEELRIYSWPDNPALWEKIKEGLNSEHYTIRKSLSIPTWIYRAGFAITSLIVVLIVHFAADKPDNGSEISFINLSSITANLDSSLYNKVVLTLADGTKLNLSDSTALTAQQGQFMIYQSGDTIYYKVSSKGKTGDSLYNKLTTPPGLSYNLAFPDGSKVYLNMSSSIKFPVNLPFTIRSATMDGEAHFDIVKNDDQPFRLTFPSNKTGAYGEVLVKGTQFNVNSYDDEEYKKVTLLTGSLLISSYTSAESLIDKPLKLKPGQQARLSTDGQLTKISKVDMTTVLDWKRGITKFEDAPVRRILSRLEKIYGITLQGDSSTIPDCHLSGTINPTIRLEDVLKVIEEKCPAIDLRLTPDAKRLIVAAK